MKKKITATLADLCILAAAFLIGTGLRERTDVLLSDYFVSEDGTDIRFEAVSYTHLMCRRDRARAVAEIFAGPSVCAFK